MNKIIITLLIAVCGGGLSAQESVQLNHRWQPGSSYVTTMNMEMDMDMRLEFSEAMREEMGGANMPDSMQMKMLMDMEITNATGERTGEEVPFKITYDKVSMQSFMNGEDNALPEESNDALLNMRIVGRYVDEQMQIDSVSGEAVDSLMTKDLQANLQGVQSHIQFPDRALMPGDTFSQVVENSFSGGMAGSMKLKVRQHYTLDRLADGTAYFTVKDHYLLDDEEVPGMFRIKEARGTGQLEFDVAGGFVRVYHNKMFMNMAMQMPGADGEMHMLSDVQMRLQTTLNN